MDTPNQQWDAIFRREGRVFSEPHESLPEIIQTLREIGASRVLDLGCGSGRHLVALALGGFRPYGVDNSPHALKIASDWLSQEHQTAPLIRWDLEHPLPFPADSFEGILSIQVIHHARLLKIQRIAKEIERCLRPTGYLFISVPRGKREGIEYKEIEPGTFVPQSGFEKGLPHHFFSPDELLSLFPNMVSAKIRVDETDHYCLSAYKKGGSSAQGLKSKGGL